MSDESVIPGRLVCLLGGDFIAMTLLFVTWYTPGVVGPTRCIPEILGFSAATMLVFLGRPGPLFGGSSPRSFTGAYSLPLLSIITRRLGHFSCISLFLGFRDRASALVFMPKALRDISSLSHFNYARSIDSSRQVCYRMVKSVLFLAQHCSYSKIWCVCG